MSPRSQDLPSEAIPRLVTLLDRQGARREYLLIQGDPALRAKLRTVRRSQDGVVLDLWWWSPFHQAHVASPERSVVLDDEETVPALVQALRQLGFYAGEPRPLDDAPLPGPTPAPADAAREVEVVLHVTLQVAPSATSAYLDGLASGLASGARSVLVWFSQVRDVVRVRTRIGTPRRRPTSPRDS